MFTQKKETHVHPAADGTIVKPDPTITINIPKRKKLVETLPGAFLEAVKETRKYKKTTRTVRRSNTADGVRKRTQSAINPSTNNNNQCANCKAFLTDGDNEAFNEMPNPVAAVLYKIRNRKEVKDSGNTKEKLDEILARISCVLQDTEVYSIFSSSSSHESIASKVDSVENATPQNKTLVELGKKKPETKKKSKREITEELLDKTEELSDTKKVLMHELDAWFESIQGEWGKVCSSQTTQAISSLFASPLDAKNKTNTLKLLNRFEDATNKLRVLIQEQLRAAIEQQAEAASQALVPIVKEKSESDVSYYSSSDEETEESIMPIPELADKIARDVDNYKAMPIDGRFDEAFAPIKFSLLLGKRLAKKNTVRKSFNAGTKHLEMITRLCDDKEQELKRLTAIIDEKDAAIKNISKSRDEMEQTYTVKLKQLHEENEEHVKTIANQEIYIESLLTPQVAVVESLKSLSSDQSSIIISDHAPNNSENGSRQVSPAEQQGSPSPAPRLVMISSSEPSASEHTPSPISSKSSKQSVIVPVEELRLLEIKIETLVTEKEQVKVENEELKKKVFTIEEDMMKIKKDTTKDNEIKGLNRKLKNYEEKYSRLANDRKNQEFKIKELEEKLANKSKFQRQLEQPREIERERDIPVQIIEEETSVKDGSDPKKKKKTVSLVVHQQAMAKLKKNWDDDVKNLRNLIISEQHRFQANLRKTHNENQKSLDKHRDDNISTVKALHRFRTSVDRLVHDMDYGRIESNSSFGAISEQSSVESRKELSMYDKGETLLETANEILLSLERKLKTFMLSKQLMVKEANSSKIFAEKELAEKDFTLSRMKQDLDEQNEKLKTVYENESSLRGEFKKMLLVNHDLQKKTTIQGRKTPNNEKDNVGKDMGEKATKQIIPFQKSNLEVGTISTCKESLRIVDYLYENNVLADKDYDVAIATIDQSTQLSNEQLVILVKRYVALKRILAIRENIISIRKQYKDKKRFKNYFNAAEARYRSAMQDLELLNVDIQKKRQNIFRELGELYLKSNMKCLSIIPLSSPNNVPVTPRKKSRQKMKKAVRIDTKMLDNVIGERLDTGKGPREPCWEMPSKVADISVSTPKILEMDVHPWKRMAKASTFRLPSIAQVYP